MFSHETSPKYQEEKATQAACLILKLNGGKMDMLKLIKLLYNIDREAMNRWYRPITFDKFCSFDYGQAGSTTYDKAKIKNQGVDSYWNNHIETIETVDQPLIRLTQDCGARKLSSAEIKLIKEFYEKYKDKTPSQMINEHHDPNLFPEWEDPHGSSNETKYRKILISLGKTEKHIQEFLEDIEELNRIDSLMG